MSNALRHRAKAADIVRLPVAAGSTRTNEAGDLMFYQELTAITTAKIVAGEEFTWDTSEAVTRAKAAATFAGVAMCEQKSTDIARDIEVATQGVFEFPAASATFRIGTLVGPAKASGSTLEPQKVVAVTNPAEAIGWVVEDHSVATTKVLVHLMSRYHTGWNPQSWIHEVSLGEIDTSGTNTLVTDWTFPGRVKLLSVAAIQTLQQNEDGVITLKNGSNSLDDTLTLASTTAVAAITRQAISDANDYDFFDIDDVMDVVVTSAATAGKANIIVRYQDMPGQY